MAAPGIAPISVILDDFSGTGRIATPALLGAMLRAEQKISDLIFSPGRPPQVQVYGQMIPVQVPGLTVLSADDTRHIAADLIADNKQAITTLREHGACDISFGLPGLARFRVNIFIQRGSCAVVMRVIPTEIPDFATLRLPQSLSDITKLRDGIVLVTGPAGSGKSSTLAVLLDAINREKNYHIITVEDPIEFLHNHKSSTIHQRELHSDTPSFAHALRSAMRQAPKVILVGEMRDRETIEIVLEAAETGHLVLSSLNTMDAPKTIERVVGSFAPGEQPMVRERFAKSFRYIVCQRLMPKTDRSGRVAAFEILKANARTRECIEKGERENKTLLEAIKAGSAEGMQHFDGDIARLVKSQVVDFETGLSFATNPAVLGQELAR
ncbi:MAG: type IV pilus twitching motility protein PilT [Candidatus Sulfotelmatobacter sp.]|nr:MAG: twitching motility protein [Acidobacteria bacterium 13_1_20CM_4_56_7]PYQ40380.1 MAG: twitching motility protein [Acidobacteriota bacterium]